MILRRINILFVYNIYIYIYIVYLRCDNGNGSKITSYTEQRNTAQILLQDREINISEEYEIWGQELEEGRPMEQTDNWGHEAKANYGIQLSLDESAMVNISSSPYLDALSECFTLEMWIRPNEDFHEECKLNLLIGGFVIQYDLTEEIVTIQEKSTNTTSTKITLSAEEEKQDDTEGWIHFTIVYNNKDINSAQFKIYLNGIMQGKSSFKGKFTKNEDLRIGPFQGSFTEFRLWKINLNEKILKANKNVPLAILHEEKQKIIFELKKEKKGGKGKARRLGGLRKPGAIKSLQMPKEPGEDKIPEELNEDVKIQEPHEEITIINDKSKKNSSHTLAKSALESTNIKSPPKDPGNFFSEPGQFGNSEPGNFGFGAFNFTAQQDPNEVTETAVFGSEFGRFSGFESENINAVNTTSTKTTKITKVDKREETKMVREEIKIPPNNLETIVSEFNSERNLIVELILKGEIQEGGAKIKENLYKIKDYLELDRVRCSKIIRELISYRIVLIIYIKMRQRNNEDSDLQYMKKSANFSLLFPLIKVPEKLKKKLYIISVLYIYSIYID